MSLDLILPGPVNPKYLEPFPWNNIASGSASGLNQAIASRVIMPVGGTISRLEFLIVSSSGNVDAGIFEWDGSANFTPLWRAGSTPAAATGAIQSFTPNITVGAGKELWVAFAADNGTITVARFASGTLAAASTALFGADTPKVTWAKTSEFPLSTSIAASGTTAPGSVIPWFRLKVT